MPRIINAYADGNTGISDSLRSLGDSMFANQANKLLVSQEALAKQRQNAAAQAASDAYAKGDLINYGANVVLNDPNSTSMGHGDLARAALDPGATQASLGTMQIGAGEGTQGTVQGQGAELANARNIAGMEVGERAREFNATPYQTTDANGNPVVSTNSAAIGTQPIPTAERIEALAVQKAIQDQSQPQQAPPAAPPTAPTAPAAPPTVLPTPASSPSNAPLTPNPQPAAAAPSAPSPAPAAQPNAPAVNGPFPGLLPNHPGVPHPLVQKALGLPPGGSVYLKPTTGQVGVSYDAGRSVQDSSTGDWYAGTANGFLPTTGEAGAAQVQGNNQRAAAENAPPIPVVNPANNAAVTDAQNTTGIWPAVQNIANEEIGALPGGPSAIKYLNGNGQIGPAQEGARSTEDIRNNEARTALLMNPGRQSTQQQKWVDELLPEGQAFGNPVTEANKIPRIVAALQGDLNDARGVISDVNTPAQQRSAAVAQVAKLQHAIRLFTQPATASGANVAPATTAPATQPNPPASQAPMTATNPKTGQKVQLVNGQWVPM